MWIQKTLLFPLLLAASVWGAEPVRIVVTHPVLDEFVRELGGAAVAVTNLVQPNVDPHTFNPKPTDVREIARAALVIGVGFEMEPYLDRLVKNSGTKARILQAGSAIAKPVHGLCRHRGHDHGGHDHEGEELDPHWWHSVRETKAVVRLLAAELGGLISTEKSAVEARLRRRLDALDALDAWMQRELERLPAARRKLVSTHDAFGYFARDCGFERIALLGTNPESEPEARALAGLIARIRAEKIPAVFVDRAENPQLLATMVRESGARLGGSLFADGPGGPGTPAPDYAGMIRHNVSTIVAALEEPKLR